MAAFRPEIWLERYVQYTRESPLIANVAVANYSNEVKGSPRKGDHVIVPGFTLGAPIFITEGTATFSSVTDVSKTITLNVEIGHAVAWNASDELLNAPGYVDAVIKQAAYRIGVRQNLEILGHATGSDVGLAISGSAVTDARLLQGAAHLDDQDAPLEDRYAVVTSLQYNDIRGISTFTSADFNPQTATNNQRIVGNVRGFNVVQRPKTEFVLVNSGSDNPRNGLLLAKGALGFAEAPKLPRIVPVGGAFRDAIEVMSLFGVTRLLPAQMVQLFTPG